MEKRVRAFILSAVLFILHITGITGAAVSAADTATAIKSPGIILIDGGEAVFDAYNINGNNYFKLRDIAYKLSGTSAQFEVYWDGANNTVSLLSGKPYTPVGGEMAISKNAFHAANPVYKTVSPSPSRVTLNGKEISLTAYLIDGSNYFKLRDIGETFDFFVGWDSETAAVIIDTSKRYIPELTEAAVYNKIIALKEQYPHGTEWGSDKYYKWKGGIYSGGYGCFSFAFILSDEAFGSLPARRHSDLSKIKIGNVKRLFMPVLFYSFNIKFNAVFCTEYIAHSKLIKTTIKMKRIFKVIFSQFVSC